MLTDDDAHTRETAKLALAIMTDSGEGCTWFKDNLGQRTDNLQLEDLRLALAHGLDPAELEAVQATCEIAHPTNHAVGDRLGVSSGAARKLRMDASSHLRDYLDHTDAWSGLPWDLRTRLRRLGVYEPRILSDAEAVELANGGGWGKVASTRFNDWMKLHDRNPLPTEDGLRARQIIDLLPDHVRSMSWTDRFRP